MTSNMLDRISAFRGTSDDLVGWREDFSMSFQVMPAQESAAAYLKQTLNDPDMRYRIGGHSKGGNLAVYAAMQCPTDQQQLIIEIYNNDGPGICDSIIDMGKYDEISSKIIRIIPVKRRNYQRNQNSIMKFLIPGSNLHPWKKGKHLQMIFLTRWK